MTDTIEISLETSNPELSVSAAPVATSNELDDGHLVELELNPPPAEREPEVSDEEIEFSLVEEPAAAPLVVITTAGEYIERHNFEMVAVLADGEVIADWTTRKEEVPSLLELRDTYVVLSGTRPLASKVNAKALAETIAGRLNQAVEFVSLGRHLTELKLDAERKKAEELFQKRYEELVAGVNWKRYDVIGVPYHTIASIARMSLGEPIPLKASIDDEAKAGLRTLLEPFMPAYREALKKSWPKLQGPSDWFRFYQSFCDKYRVGADGKEMRTPYAPCLWIKRRFGNPQDPTYRYALILKSDQPVVQRILNGMRSEPFKNSDEYPLVRVNFVELILFSRFYLDWLEEEEMRERQEEQTRIRVTLAERLGTDDWAELTGRPSQDSERGQAKESRRERDNESRRSSQRHGNGWSQIRQEDTTRRE